MNSVADFVSQLGQLSDSEMSHLRQCAGKPMSETVQGFDLFTSIYWRLDRRRLDKRWLWLGATMYPWNPLPKGEGSFGMAWRRIRPGKSEEGNRHDQRMFRIVACGGLDVGPLLFVAIRELRRQGVSVDWTRLITDLHGWSRDGGNVQRKWAEDYLHN